MINPDIFITNLLDEKNIKYQSFRILQTKWGYVVQAECDRKEEKCSYNALFDYDWNIIQDFKKIKHTMWGIYQNHREMSSLESIKSFQKNVYYIELDDKHFIIPKLQDGKDYNALFSINENNMVEHKDDIEGILDYFDTRLAKYKILEVRDDENEECFFYSWDKCCEVSDRWTGIYTDSQTLDFKLQYIENIFPEMRQYLVETINQSEVFLTTLELHSKDGIYNMDLICLIGYNGIPVTDLLYVSDDYQLKTIKISKDKIGELKQIKEHGERRLEKKSEIREKNKRAIFGELSLINNTIFSNKIEVNSSPTNGDDGENSL